MGNVLSFERFQKEVVGKPLGQVVRETEDEKVRRFFMKQISMASAATGGSSFEDVKVGSVQEMGDAGGQFNTVSEERKLRADLLFIRSETHKDVVAGTLAHEEIHKQDVHLEGACELETIEALGGRPVDAYADAVAAAREMRNTIGRKEYNEAIYKGAEAEVILLSTYYNVKVGEAVTPEESQQIVEEGRSLIHRMKAA